jgi:hypothetical protein
MGCRGRHWLASVGPLAVCVGLAVVGCGRGSSPELDREAVEDVVTAFFKDGARKDVGAVCGALTGVGRAQAAGSPRVIGRRPKPASEERCVAEGAYTATRSEELPTAIDRGWLELKRVRVSGSRARVDVCNGARCVTQSLRETAGGWRIELFGLPVE